MAHNHVFKGSSSIANCSYDSEKGCMEIEFISGGRYRYPDCKYDDYHNLTQAESPGKHFHKFIKHLKAEKL